MDAAFPRRNLLPFILVAMLFLLWGVANNMNDTLLAAFRRIMSMSDLQTSLVQFSFYGAYFCFALPAAMFIRRYSYKSGIILGLALYAAGTMLFYPAGLAASYGFYLVAIYVMAGGCAVLETTANPYILSMGDKDMATRRLNIAQMFNPVGAICGILLSRHFILSELNDADVVERGRMTAQQLHALRCEELSAVSGAYMIIGCVLVALLMVIAVVRMPRSRDDGPVSVKGMSSTVRRLYADRRYRYGVVAQFFYVGVQTCVWSFTIRLVMHHLAVDEKSASLAFLCSIILFTLFRFLFTWLMKYVRPVVLLVVAAIAGFLFTAGVVGLDGMAAVVCLVMISAAMSLMFPTIYGIALENVDGTDMKLASSGLIMAILGGAVLTPVQAGVSDLWGPAVSFVVPLLCFIVIFVYAFYVILLHGNR